MPAISADNFQSVCFWGEVAPCDHLVHIYEDDAPFIDALSGFVAGGLLAGDAVIAIATPEHLKAVDARLAEYSITASMRAP